MQGSLQKNPKRRALRSGYTSPSQLSLPEFETPFYNQLDPDNRWVRLGAQIPWDDLVSLINKNILRNRPGGRPRILIGGVIIQTYPKP